MSSGAHHTGGQLVTPTELVPWSVEVVSAVPLSIMKSTESPEEPKKKKKKITQQHIPLDRTQINAGAVCPGWACLASWRGPLYVWPVTTSSSSSSSTSSSPSKQQKPVEAPISCVTLFHPLLTGISEDGNPLLVALSPASPDSVYVYACNPINGELFVWKVSRDDVQRAETMQSRQVVSAHITVPLDRRDLDEDDDEVVMEGSSGEFVEFPSSLTVVDRHILVVGTTKGALICCTQSTIPLALHYQRMLKTRPRSLLGLGGLLSFGSEQDVGANVQDESSIVFALPLPVEEERCTELLAVSLLGSIWHWKIKETVATSHRVETEANCLTTIATLFPNTESLSHLEILETELKEERMHVLVRMTQDSDEKLYWVVLRLERDGSRVALHWLGCHYLDRFAAPQDIETLGLVLSEANGTAYAAFHQGSGGITSSVIIFCLVTESESDNLLEVNLPQTEIPAFLPGTFSNDMVTHGVCGFARSGVGIRMRALPPSMTASALSPRAVKRASPSALMKLTSHLRGAFWEAYQHQGTAADGALPPSIKKAAPVDLEEAVIALATEFHTQRSTDSTGWSSASSALEANPLEFHLALVAWLRQRGVYRHLSTYGKWRLMRTGMEIAAYLELIKPTRSPTSTPWEQQQVSSLKLAKVAHWLKQTLETTLKDGGMDHYKQWCGWFGTALATAVAYRTERAGSNYDITLAEKPPKIGSNEEEERTQRVPVWTSHPVLQDIFGTLLQHWKANPKQKSSHVLPPQTVGIIAKAALDSFADSAYSLSSDRAIGKYAEIKALTIPLLRTLHPPTPQVPTAHKGVRNDDILAFELSVRHDYYEGICQIALDHENKPDKHNFELAPLLKSTDKCQSKDYQTGLTFGQFVLQWHTDKKLYGHTITLGRMCHDPADLSNILQSDKRLRPYRWIQAIHDSKFQAAASSLVGEDEAEKSPAATLRETKWSFCMARLSNCIALKESEESQSEVPFQVRKRETKIYNTLELVGIQQQLLDGELSKSQSGQHLWSASRLLSLALEKSEEAQETEDATQNCYLGLLVCATFEDKATQQQEATKVWAKAISFNQTQWTEWIRTLDDLSTDALARTILDTTVFGGLLQECAHAEALPNVTYNKFMENEVIQSLGFVQDPTGVDAFRRVLFNVKAFHDANVGEEDDEMVDVQ